MDVGKGKPPKATRFKKGQSGNPAGRPKKLPELDSLIADVLGEEKDGLTAAAAILKKWRQMAAQGNLKAGEMLMDRAYGKPKQAHEHSGPGGEAIEIKTWVIEVQPPPVSKPGQANPDPEKTNIA